MSDTRARATSQFNAVRSLCLLAVISVCVENSQEVTRTSSSMKKLHLLSGNRQMFLQRQTDRRVGSTVNFEVDSQANKNYLEKENKHVTQNRTPSQAEHSNAGRKDSNQSEPYSNGWNVNDRSELHEIVQSNNASKGQKKMELKRQDLREKHVVTSRFNKNKKMLSIIPQNYEKGTTQRVTLAVQKVRKKQEEDKYVASLAENVEILKLRSEIWDSSLCSPCICAKSISNNRTYAHCRDKKGPKTIPTTLPKDIWALDMSSCRMECFNMENVETYLQMRELDLSNNQISSIKNKNLSKIMPNLTSIYFNKNHIEYLTSMNCYNFPALKYLVLSNNCIKIIPYSAFEGCHNLRTLDLSRNKITLIEKSSFDPLNNLLELDLSFNKHLGYDRQSFTPRIFQGLQKLQKFYLQGSSSDSQHYPNQALQNLTNLRELYIDGIGHGAEFGAEMKSLIHLKNLSFSPGTCSCHIKSISSSFFENIPFIKSLAFNFCNLTFISPKAFRYLKKLKSYSIHAPRSYKLCQAFADLKGLVNSPLKNIAFTGFRSPDLPCQSISMDMGKPIRDFKLEELDLSKNNLVALETDFLTILPKTLNKLMLNDNKFTVSNFNTSMQTLSLFSNLSELDLQNQNYEYISRRIIHEEEFYETCPAMSTSVAGIQNALDTRFHSGNNSSDRPKNSCISKDSRCMSIPITNVENFIESGEKVPKYAKENELRKASVILLPPNLDTLNVSRFQFYGQWLLSHKANSENLLHIDFSSGVLTEWGSGVLPETVMTADLSDNHCKILKPSFFPENNSLQSLLIKSNYLGPVFTSDVNGDLFAHAGQLAYLDISLNTIFYLPSKFLRGLKSLQRLILTENKLQSIDMDFSYTPALRVFYVNKNSVRWISRSARRSLDLIASKHAINVDLTNNPLPCTCDGIEILRWLLKTNVHILNKDFLKCAAHDNGNEEDIGNIEEKVNELRAKCDQTGVTVSAFLGAVFFLIITLALLYRHRWKLIYMRNVWLVNVYGFRPIGNTTTEHIYDAYVVYCQDDRDFALDTMLEELEEKRGHRLCVEDRDFIPGSFNFNNITCAVHNSTITLLLVSPSFLCDKELEYATQMALMEEHNGQNKRDILLLLNHKRTNHKAMSKDLLMLMKKGRFLDYPGLDDGEDITDVTVQSFWDRLSHEIGHNDTQNSSSFLNRGQRS